MVEKRPFGAFSRVWKFGRLRLVHSHNHGMNSWVKNRYKNKSALIAIETMPYVSTKNYRRMMLLLWCEAALNASVFCCDERHKSPKIR